MVPDEDVPPGLGLRPDHQQAKSKNPRRRAKQRLSEIESGKPSSLHAGGDSRRKPGESLVPEALHSTAALAPGNGKATPSRQRQGNGKAPGSVAQPGSQQAQNGRNGKEGKRKGDGRVDPRNGVRSSSRQPQPAETKSADEGAAQAAPPDSRQQPDSNRAGPKAEPQAAQSVGVEEATAALQAAACAVEGGHSDAAPAGRRERRQKRGSAQSGRRRSIDVGLDQDGQRSRKLNFKPHMAGAALSNSLKTGRVLRCQFRVNANDRRQGFAGFEGLPADIQIQTLEDQNRAFPGDEVAVEILPQAEWLEQRVSVLRSARKAIQGSPDNPNYASLEELLDKMAVTPSTPSVDKALRHSKSPEQAKQALIEKLVERPDLRATGRVVAVLEPSFRRQRVVGVLRLQDEGASCLLTSVDPRLPMGNVDPNKLPQEITALLQDQAENPDTWHLVSAYVLDWPHNSMYPNLAVRGSIGQAGEIEVETQAILEAEGVDTDDFSADVLACLPPTPWSIADAELAARRDFRSVRTFTIDPPTARDLDDALSVEPLGGGKWRIGVHIADVSHFIPPGSALDAKAAERATTVYLVQRAVPMLPPLLCEELCSLNPGVDRLAFSVVWDMDEAGNVLQQWAGRTVIRSCTKLAYRHAQEMIDGSFSHEPPPVPLETPNTWEQVKGDVAVLHKISRKLHARRFQGGALRLDNVKLSFQLNAEGNPVTVEIYEQQEANELVAEFMLLANMSVAQLIGHAFPDKAMLRRHQAPEDRKLGELEAAAQKLGYDIDCSSAGSIQASLKLLRQRGEDPVILDILQLIATKPMKQAQYFSTGSYADANEWRHFALAVPMYTHFTSPIRRYPDVVVHRLLARLLETQPAAATRKFHPDPLAQWDGNSQERPDRQAAAAAALEEVCELGEELREDEDEMLLDVEEKDFVPEDVSQKAPPRLLAEKAGQPRGKSWSKLVKKVPVSTSLLESDELQRVADHCNERKTSAKSCSDASSRLHLCVMLRAQPMVQQAVVTVVNGSRFFDLYIPTLGLEARIQVADMLPQARATWSLQNRVVTLHPEAAQTQEAAVGESSPSPSVPCLAAVSNADKLHNPAEIQPVSLPLEVKAFSKLPVVVSAKSAGAAKPLVLFAMLFLRGDTAAAAAPETKPAGAARTPALAPDAGSSGALGEAIQSLGAVPGESCRGQEEASEVA